MNAKNYIITTFLKSLKYQPPHCFMKAEEYFKEYHTKIEGHLKNGLLAVLYDRGEIFIGEGLEPPKQKVFGWCLVEKPASLVYIYVPYRGRRQRSATMIFERLNKHLKLGEGDKLKVLYPTRDGVKWLRKHTLKLNLDIKQP